MKRLMITLLTFMATVPIFFFVWAVKFRDVGASVVQALLSDNSFYSSVLVLGIVLLLLLFVEGYILRIMKNAMLPKASLVLVHTLSLVTMIGFVVFTDLTNPYYADSVRFSLLVILGEVGLLTGASVAIVSVVADAVGVWFPFRDN